MAQTFLDVKSGQISAHQWDEYNASLISAWGRGKYGKLGGRPRKTLQKPSRFKAETLQKPDKSGLDKRREEKREEKTKQSLTHACGMQDVIDFAVSLGLPANDGEYFWEKWQGNGNQNAGKSIKDWRAVIRSWKLAGHCPSQKAHNGSNGRGNGATSETLHAHEKATKALVVPDGFDGWLRETYPDAHENFKTAPRTTQDALVSDYRKAMK